MAASLHGHRRILAGGKDYRNFARTIKRSTDRISYRSALYLASIGGCLPPNVRASAARLRIGAPASITAPARDIGMAAEEDGALADRIAILVTGMHRSGTSALARTMSLLGASLPADLIGPNEGNPHGHWEPSAIVGLNDRMLADAGSDLYSTIEVDAAWFSTPRAASFVEEAVGVIRAAYGSDAFIVLKDPRVALMLPVWDLALAQAGYSVVHVVPLRHPASVAASLRRRHLKTIPYDAWPRPRGELVWLRYMLAAVRGSRGRPRSFLSYAAFLGDWRREMRRVAAETGIVWPRLGPADREIDAFLHGNDQAERPGGPDMAEPTKPASQADFAELAGLFYAGLVREGGDGGFTDDVEAEYSTRMAGSRDLIRTLEDLYPLVWTYYEQASDLRRRIELGQESEGNLHHAVQHLWSDLTRTNGEKGVLRQDLSTTAERVRSLEHTIHRLGATIEDNKRVLDETRRTLDETRRTLHEMNLQRDDTRGALGIAKQEIVDFETAVAELTAETMALEEDREAVRRDADGAKDELLQTIAALTEANAALSEANAELEAAQADLAAAYEESVESNAHLAELNGNLETHMHRIRASLSWTLTKPLRFLLRLVRR